MTAPVLRLKFLSGMRGPTGSITNPVQDSITFANDRDGVTFSGGGSLYDAEAIATVLEAHGDNFSVYNEAGSATMFSVVADGLNKIGTETVAAWVNPFLKADTGAAAASALGFTWTNYTPTVTSATGSYTSAVASGKYFSINKLVFFYTSITIVTLGTAAGRMVVTLPVAAAAADGGTVVGWNVSNGKILGGNVGIDNLGAASFLTYDTTHPAAVSGTFLTAGGFYQSV